MDFEQLKTFLLKFAAERDWEQFQSPKNLSMALSVEAAELLEHFQWLSEAQSRELNEDKRKQVSHEIADIIMYAILSAARLNIDIESAIMEKITINQLRYPATKVRGSSKKYSEYPP